MATRHRIWLLGTILALGLSTPAPALLIDDFSTGGFNLQAGSGGASSTQACGAFCITGAREVFLQSGNAVLDASVQLLFAPGEVANVMPDGGGLLRFTYAAVAGTSHDLSVGGAGADLEVWFNAFELGATVRVLLEDTSGASETVSVTPSPFIIPGPVDVPLSSFVGVDLEQIVRIEVTIDAPAAGDYHVFLIWIPEPDMTSELSVGTPSLSGGPYPTEPITLEACVDAGGGTCTPTLGVELSLVDVSTGGRALPALVDATAIASPADDLLSIGSEVMGVDPQPFRIVYRLDYFPPEPIVPPEPILPVDANPVLSWSPGEDHLQVTVDVAVEGGVQTLTLFAEPEPGQAIHFADVSAVKGSSTLITVDVDGSGSDPTLHMALGSQFTPAAVPALPGWALAALAGALGIGARALLRLRSR